MCLDLSARNPMVQGSSNKMLISQLQDCRRIELCLDYLSSRSDLMVTLADVDAQTLRPRETWPYRRLL